MAYNREYYLKNREKFLEATKRYIAKKRAENDEEWLKKQAEYMKEYYAKNPDQKEKKKQRDKEWRMNHPDYFKNYKKKKQEKQEEKKEEKNED